MCPSRPSKVSAHGQSKPRLCPFSVPRNRSRRATEWNRKGCVGGLGNLQSDVNETFWMNPSQWGRGYWSSLLRKYIISSCRMTVARLITVCCMCTYIYMYVVHLLAEGDNSTLRGWWWLLTSYLCLYLGQWNFLISASGRWTNSGQNLLFCRNIAEQKQHTRIGLAPHELWQNQNTS